MPFTSRCCCQRQYYHQQQPVSNYCASLIFRLLGIGILVPWNAFISAVPYFQWRLCSIPGASQQFESWVGLIFNLSSVAALVLLLAWPHCSQQHQQHHHRQQQPQPQQHQSSLLPWRRQRQWRRPWRRQQRHSSVNNSNSTGTTHATIADDDPRNQEIVLQDTTSNNQQVVVPAVESMPENPSRHYRQSHWHVTIPLALCLAVFVATDTLVAIKSIRPQTFLTMTLWGMAIAGACQALAQAGTIATSGLYPHAIGVTPFISGQAVGGVIVSAANFLSAIAEGPQTYWEQHCTSNHTATAASVVGVTRDTTTIIPTCPSYDAFDAAVFFYFLIGSIVLFACVVGYMMLDQTTQYETLPMDHALTTTTTITTDEFQDEPSSPDQLRHQRPFDITQAGCDSMSVHDTAYDNSSDDVILRDPTSLNNHEAPITNQQAPGESVLICIQGPAFCIFFTFLVTLALFPSWTSRLRSIHQCQPSSGRLSNDLYVPFTFLLFNLGDLGGREIAGRLPMNRISNLSYKLVFAACGRCLFLPLLLICASGSQTSNDTYFVVNSDMYSFAVQAMLALTNGGLITLAFMHAPTLLPDTPGAIEKSSEILTLCCSFGLLCGSLCAFPVSKLAV